VQTDELIEALAVQTGRIGRAEPQRRLVMAAASAVLIALVLVLLWLGLRPDLAGAMAGRFFWIKAAYTAAIAVGAGLACERLVRPGVAAGRAWMVGVGALALFALAALVQYAGLDADGRLAALRGVSWQVCSRNILVLGGPSTLVTLLALRAFAPTRPMWTGFAAGAFAGGVAATVYGLHCPEATFVFVSLWYTLGVLACAGTGAVLGRWLLRW
jgi:hypothetical protein